MIKNYLPILITFILAAGFVSVSLILTHFVGPRINNKVKMMPYESGVDPVGETRIRFSIRFFLIALLFIIFDIEIIYEKYANLNNYNFIIFIDDLSFEKIDSDYKIIKSTLDGSIQNQPTNIVLYITSNRRHLMPRDMIDNERSSAIHTDESVEEKISLSDRFGLWIGFHNLSQIEYLKIVKSYCNFY